MIPYRVHVLIKLIDQYFQYSFAERDCAESHSFRNGWDRGGPWVTFGRHPTRNDFAQTRSAGGMEASHSVGREEPGEGVTTGFATIYEPSDE